MANKRNRASKEEFNKRVEQLLALKAQGYSSSQLVEVSQKAWGLSGRQPWRYLTEVKKREKALASQNIGEHQGRLLSQLNFIYTQAISKGDHNTAVRAISAQIPILKLGNTGVKGHVTPSTQEKSVSPGLQAALEACEGECPPE